MASVFHTEGMAEGDSKYHRFDGFSRSIFSMHLKTINIIIVNIFGELRFLSKVHQNSDENPDDFEKVSIKL